MLRHGSAPTTEELRDRVLAGDRSAIARAITLAESGRADHHDQAQELLVALMPHTGRAQRVGISGVPGVGKSTFIDQLGVNLTRQGHRVAVLAVDPSSARTGGSILGDRTRMARLANDERAFVRASPSRTVLGGVAAATRESMVVVEAAGYDVVFVETVGVGQSEYVIADMVDTFLLLALARTGDSLQGMKRGILELVDVIAVNKADAEHEAESRAAARQLSSALRLMRGSDQEWQIPVTTCSGLHNLAMDEVWGHVQRHRAYLDSDGGLAAKRQGQLVQWTRAMVRDRMLARLEHPALGPSIEAAEAGVLSGRVTPQQAADQIVAAERRNSGCEDPATASESAQSNQEAQHG